ARAMKFHGGAADARLEVERALRQGDSSAATLVLSGELLAGAGRFRDAERAYRAAARDSALGALAIYRRARILARLGDARAAAAAPQRMSARFWLGKLAFLSGDTAAARASWLTLAREDSVGYYGLRARREVNLPPLRFAAAPLPAPPASIAVSLGRLDTLLLA